MKKESWLESLINVLLSFGLIFGLVLLLSLNVDAGSAEITDGPLDDWLKLIVGYLAAGLKLQRRS